MRCETQDARLALTNRCARTANARGEAANMRLLISTSALTKEVERHHTPRWLKKCTGLLRVVFARTPGSTDWRNGLWHLAQSEDGEKITARRCVILSRSVVESVRINAVMRALSTTLRYIARRGWLHEIAALCDHLKFPQAGTVEPDRRTKSRHLKAYYSFRGSGV